MKISTIVVLGTGQRLAGLVTTLFASLKRAPQVALELVLVDTEQQLGADVIIPETEQLYATKLIPGSSAASTARNARRQAGLRAASGDYAVFLDDGNLVTPDWVQVVFDCATAGKGFACKTHLVNDLRVPDDGIVRMKDRNDLLRNAPPMTVNSCWGAPTASLAKVHGFDMSFEGDSRGADIELPLRLSRTGLQFVTTARAFSINLRRGAAAKESPGGSASQHLLNELIRDRSRTLPLVEAAPPPAAARAEAASPTPPPAPPAAPVAAAAPAPAAPVAPGGGKNGNGKGKHGKRGGDGHGSKKAAPVPAVPASGAVPPVSDVVDSLEETDDLTAPLDDLADEMDINEKFDI